MNKFTRRARALAIVCSVIALLGAGTQIAAAADNVVVTQGSIPGGSLGTVTVTMRFDNTNCTANTASNCVSPNGASLVYIDITSTAGTLSACTGSDVCNVIYYDIWGDGLTCAPSGKTRVVTWQRLSARHIKYSPPATDDDADHVRRAQVAGVSSGSNFSRYQSRMLNPFGYDTSGGGYC